MINFELKKYRNNEFIKYETDESSAPLHLNVSMPTSDRHLGFNILIISSLEPEFLNILKLQTGCKCECKVSKKVCGYFQYKIKCRLLDLILIFS
jgi:hypothetical protein